MASSPGPNMGWKGRESSARRDGTYLLEEKKVNTKVKPRPNMKKQC